jgi:hypothetical protein
MANQWRVKTPDGKRNGDLMLRFGETLEFKSFPGGEDFNFIRDLTRKPLTPAS